MSDKKKRNFKDDDLFKRQPYANFLKNLILNCNNYHRDDDVKAYTIALDSPWGTGKSVFLEKFESLLENAPECKNKFRVVHYNAWENDFWNNAFEPFADAVFSHSLFTPSFADKTEEKAIVKVGSAMKHLALAFTKKRLENYFDAEQLADAGAALAGAVNDYVSQNPNAISPTYSTYKDNLKEMQDAMRMVLQEELPDGKLVIIIDELDRCRPTFAIETLEIVKHIMDVPNIVYVFAVDIRQLSSAVKKVYGEDTDSIGYLMRFFSYYTHLPEAKMQFVIENIVNSINFKIHDARTDFGQGLSDEYGNPYPNSVKMLQKDMLQISNALALSVRDLETIGKVYEIMHESFLKEYQNRCAYLLYWFLLCAKYKQPLRFDEWINDKDSEIAFPVLPEQENRLPAILHDQIEMLCNQDPISSVLFCIRQLSDDPLEDGAKIIVETSNTSEDGEDVAYVNYDYEENIIDYIPLEKRGDLSGVLFVPDLLNWKKIKNLTLKQYYSQKMEMFNFLT